ncbi:putative cysteine desulfurase, partial [Chlamydia psittaci 84-8471/1]
NLYLKSYKIVVYRLSSVIVPYIFLLQRERKMSSLLP